MKIFEVDNRFYNECKGTFWFCAKSTEEVKRFMKEFCEDHNLKYNFNPNYTVDFEAQPIIPHILKPGYLGLGRGE